MRLVTGSGVIATVIPVSSAPPLEAPSILQWERGVKKQTRGGEWASLSGALSFQILPHRHDLLEHLLVGHDSLPHQHSPEGISSGHKLPIRRGQDQAESAGV